jgi:limonene-1,2-epoxide hydrolase
MIFMDSSIKEIVLSFLKAIEEQDYKTARSYVTDNVSFYAPDGSPLEGSEDYFKGLEPLHLKYDVKKVFSEGNDVCVIYDITFSARQVVVFACGLYQVQNSKINSIRVLFDPRPLFQPQK